MVQIHIKRQTLFLSDKKERCSPKALLGALLFGLILEFRFFWKQEESYTEIDPVSQSVYSLPRHDVAHEILSVLKCEEKKKKNTLSGAFCYTAKKVVDNKFDYPIDTLKLNLKCDVETILQIWLLAREKMSLDIMNLALSDAIITSRKLLGFDVSLVAPTNDIGIGTVLDEINKGNGIAEYDIRKLPLLLKDGKSAMFTDLGSNLGLVSLAVALLYPNVNILSIEAAAPTWMYQQWNLKCNVQETQITEKNRAIHVVHAGAGSTDMNGKDTVMMWRPHATTSTRSWTIRNEHHDEDLELKIPMRTVRSIRKEYFPKTESFDVEVMKIDCEGCEYNVIPDMSDKEFDAFDIAVGEVHWGYIPKVKKPSSKRGKMTHKKLCRHENFARQAMECCAFGDMIVDHDLGMQKNNKTYKTVRELSGKLCDSFEKWAKDKNLIDIPDDSNWLDRKSSMA